MSFAIMLLALLAGATPRQDTPLGAWEGEGTLMGRPAKFALCWHQGPHPGLVRLEYRILPDGAPAFRAAAWFLAAGDSKYEGHWFDSRGVTFSVTGTSTARGWETVWTGSAESGRTTYERDGDALVATDYVNRDGQATRFASARYRQVSACPIPL